jgi:hypothetical protein
MLRLSPGWLRTLNAHLPGRYRKIRMVPEELHFVNRLLLKCGPGPVPLAWRDFESTWSATRRTETIELGVRRTSTAYITTWLRRQAAAAGAQVSLRAWPRYLRVLSRSANI